MILLNFFIGFFTIFISPQIFLYYRYNDIKYSLILVYGLIISFSGSWILFLIIFYFKLPHIYIYLVALLVFISSLIYMYVNGRKNINDKHNYIIWLITIIAMMPLLFHIGDGFTGWDAVVSWNRWASELFNNEYNPMGAAYPILLPSLWALIYKIQGTSEIWWTAQITIFVIPIMTFAILLTLYHENKNKSFIFMAIFLYPYLIWTNIINGFMDMPVMLLGTLSIVMLYAAEINKDKVEFEYYIYAALLLAGIASITKQAGFAFLLFDFMYIILNIRLFKNKKQLLLIGVISLLYFMTYLTIYYQYQDNVIGNLNALQKLSAQKIFLNKDTNHIIQQLWNSFFSYPPYISWLSGLFAPLKIMPLTPYFIGIGLSLFVIKDLRKYNSVGFLSGIFFFIGLVVWIKYFSYDSRNSYWVKSFFIIFLSINLNYLFTKYLQNYIPNIDYSFQTFKVNKIIETILFLIILATLFFTFYLGNNFAYKKQQLFQEKIGEKELAKEMVELLKNKNECVEIYINKQTTRYNYHARKIFNKVYQAGGLGFVFDSLEHNCSDGRYMILGAKYYKEKMYEDEWKRIFDLEKKQKLQVIKKTKETIIYFVPPNMKIED